MKKVLLSFLILSLNIIIVKASTKESVKLSKCVDGDTAVFKIKNTDTRVRFLAIDTPESVHPTKEEEFFGKDASEYTCNKLTNAKKIELEYEKSKTDKYGRTLAWVWVDNNLLQSELIDIGYAKVKYIYSKYAYTEVLYKHEKIAKDKKIGIWANYQPVTYTITFKDGEEKTKIKVLENETVESIKPNKDGYIFLGWYYENEKFDFNTKITTNIELEAKYIKKLSIQEIILLIIVLLILFTLNPQKLKKIKRKDIIYSSF